MHPQELCEMQSTIAHLRRFSSLPKILRQLKTAQIELSVEARRFSSIISLLDTITDFRAKLPKEAIFSGPWLKESKQSLSFLFDCEQNVFQHSIHSDSVISLQPSIGAFVDACFAKSSSLSSNDSLKKKPTYSASTIFLSSESTTVVSTWGKLDTLEKPDE